MIVLPKVKNLQFIVTDLKGGIVKKVALIMLAVVGTELVLAAPTGRAFEPGKSKERREFERDGKPRSTEAADVAATRMDMIEAVFPDIRLSSIENAELKVTDGEGKNPTTLSLAKTLGAVAKRVQDPANAERVKVLSKKGQDAYYLGRLAEITSKANAAGKGDPALDKLMAISADLLSAKTEDGALKYAQANFKSLTDVIRSLVDASDATIGKEFDVKLAMEKAVGSKEKLKELENCQR